MISSQIFKAKGVIKEISNVRVFNNEAKFINIKVELKESNQILDFFVTETPKTPSRFQYIRKHFENNSLKLGDYIEFDFNIVINNKNLTKLKIFNLYNIKYGGLENKDK